MRKALAVSLAFLFCFPAWAQWGGNAKKLMGIPISPTPPTNGQSLVFNELQKMWVPATISGGGGGGGGFPLSDIGPKANGYVGITQTYSLDSSCTSLAPCAFDFESRTLNISDVNAIDTINLFGGSWSADDGANVHGGWFGATLANYGPGYFNAEVGFGASFGSGGLWEIYGGGYPGWTRISLRAIAGTLEIGTGNQYASFSLTSGPRTWGSPVATPGVFYFVDQDDQAPVASFVFEGQELRGASPNTVLDVRVSRASLVRVIGNGLVQLSAVAVANLPACDSSQSGAIAYVSVDASNTDLRVCKQVSGVWQWVSL